jgi:hypothetical protein
MKIWSDPAQAAIVAGEALSVGAVYIGSTPPIAVWSGFGDLELDDLPDVIFKGIGDHGLVAASAGQIGPTAQGVTLSLSGVEPDALALFDAVALRGAAVVLWRLVFNATGSTLLDAKVFTRGQIDQLQIEQTPGGTSTITATIEGAARASGRRGGRMRSDADQRAIDAADAGLSVVSYAGQKMLYWGGKRPATAAEATPGATVAPDYEMSPQ